MTPDDAQDRARRRLALVVVILTLLGGTPDGVRGEDDGPSPEARALGYLAREVPRWSRENHCYSCHNNGDAARALYAAVLAGMPPPDEALSDTTRWLLEPSGWDRNGGDGPFSDKRLARLQFASALASAGKAGRVADRTVLVRAAARVADDQAEDGSFPLEGGDSLGSPGTYGRPLATRILRDTLNDADPERFRAAIGRADRWLVGFKVVGLLDAAAVLPVVSSAAGASLPEAGARRRDCLELIRAGQSTDGGWGPYASSPPEPFDTAVVLLALARSARAGPVDEALRVQMARGRAFLVANQNAEGSWNETTRPAGAESYAQRLSTTGWATLALLATREPPRP